MLFPTSLLLQLLLTAAAAASAFPDLPPFVNPWLSFQSLSGCHMGDERPGLAGLKDYLSHFGYLPSPPSFSNFSDSFDEQLEAAIQTYQRNFGLNVTGMLDPSTVDQMIAPRCGVADVINGTSTMNSSFTRGRNLFAYFAGNPTWPPLKRDLKYALTATSNTAIDKATLSAVFARAFAQWSAATTLTFAETESASDADMTIGFYYGAHGDGEPFDGVLGTLAHAFSPTDGRFHLDAAETWVAGGDVTRAASDTAVDLESVAVHEIGHLLGMGHSAVAEAVMYPTIKTRTRKVDLALDDVEGIQQLYGSNPNFKGVAPSTTGSSWDMETSDGGGGGGGRGRWGWSWLVVVVAVLLAGGESLRPCTSFF